MDDLKLSFVTAFPRLAFMTARESGSSCRSHIYSIRRRGADRRPLCVVNAQTETELPARCSSVFSLYILVFVFLQPGRTVSSLRITSSMSSWLNLG